MYLTYVMVDFCQGQIYLRIRSLRAEVLQLGKLPNIIGKSKFTARFLPNTRLGMRFNIRPDGITTLSTPDAIFTQEDIFLNIFPF